MRILLFLSILFTSHIAFTGARNHQERIDRMTMRQIMRYDSGVDAVAMHYHFQKQSTWIRMPSKRLCTDGEFVYGGTIVKSWCNDGGDRCRTKEVELIQPIHAFRERCNEDRGDWRHKCEVIDYIQPITRLFTIVRNFTDQHDRNEIDRNTLGYKLHTIPSCDENGEPEPEEPQNPDIPVGAFLDN